MLIKSSRFSSTVRHKSNGKTPCFITSYSGQQWASDKTSTSTKHPRDCPAAQGAQFPGRGADPAGACSLGAGSSATVLITALEERNFSRHRKLKASDVGFELEEKNHVLT